MSDYCLSCCSTADLSRERFEKRNIKYVCFRFSLNGIDYPDDLGKTIPPAELYSRMLNGEEAKTSQVSAGAYMDFFDSILSEGHDLLHLTLSSGISGTINSALVAAEAMREKYPERKIYIVDSLAASSGYGLIMETLADMRDRGDDIDTVYNWIEKHKLNMHHWFFSTDLTFYIRGGRVSRTSGYIGKMFGICPLLNVDYKGRLIPREKIISKKKVVRRTVEKMAEFAKYGTDYSGKVFICHSECYEDAQSLAELIKETFPKLKYEPEIFNIGAVIGSHTGPGTVALFFWGKARQD